MANITKDKKDMTTIQIEKDVAKKLQKLFIEWGDTYNAVILRLLDGKRPGEKGEPRGGG